MKVPNARIMTYGYNSVVAFSKSVAEIEEFAVNLLNGLDGERGMPQEKARPVIFICHSLGGIVVKKVRLLSTVGRNALTVLFRHSYLPMSGQTIMATCSKRFVVLSSWGPHTADQTVLTGLTFLLARSMSPNLGVALIQNFYQPFKRILKHLGRYHNSPLNVLKS